MKEKIRVAIIFGGKSAEHEISIISAKNVIDAIDKEKYEPLPIGIDKDGSWYLNEQSKFILENSNPKLAKINKADEKVALVPTNNSNELRSITSNQNKGKIDVAFPILHGTYGEDGSIQGLLRMANIPYVGADVLGSAVGMDKDVLKRLLRDANIPVHKFEVFDKERMGGERVVDAFLESYILASLDPYRAATHNKGIMNGIDGLIIATGNDFRAIEAGAHAYAARNGRYTSLTSYHKNENGDLIGEIELPIAVGIIGGAANMHPKAKLCRKILGIVTAQELAEIAVSLGLAQNFAAVLALSTVGIQKGHMSLHAKNIAVMAGAVGEEIEKTADKMVKEGKIKLERAKEILKEIR